MKDVTIEKGKLLEALNKNREEHKKIFEEACIGYQKEAEKQLKDHLKRVKEGKRQNVLVHLIAPVDQTREYDRAIKMIEMHVDQNITLTEQDFRQYVMDDWTWMGGFLSSNSLYSQTAVAKSAGMGYTDNYSN